MLDAVLGELSEDNDNELVGRFTVGDDSVRLTIFLEGATPEQVLPAARELKATLPQTLERVRQELIKAFLPLVNGGYLEDGQAPLGEAEFVSRARLEGVELDSESNARFHFHDDDMLWGHWMTVEVGVDRASWRAHMWG
jgi:hypothetical protein